MADGGAPDTTSGDLPRLYDALRQADAAGDKDGAAKLAGYIRSYQPTPAPKDNTPAATPPEPSTLATRVGHGALDVAGTVARGVGDVVGAGKNLYRMANSEPTAPVTDTGESFAAPFSHAPDVPVDSAYNRAMQGTKTLGEDIASAPPVKSALESNAGRLVTDIARPVGEIANAAMVAKGGVEAVKAGAGALDMAANAGKTPAPPVAAHENLARARADGWQITPSDANYSTGGKAGGAQTSTPADAYAAQAHNIPKATADMASDVKLPTKTSINPSEVTQRMADEGKVYDETGNAVGSGRQVTPKLAGDIDAARQQVTDRTGQNKIDDLVNTYKDKYSGTMDGPQTIQDIRALRFESKGWAQSEDPIQQKLGLTQQRIASALEDELGRQIPVQNQGLLQRWQDARTQIAKLHELQEVTEGGQVNPAKVLQLRDAGAPLSGAADSVANAADVAPEGMTRPSGAPKDNTPMPIGHFGAERTLYNTGRQVVHKLVPGMNPMTDAYQAAHYGPEGGSAATPPAGAPTGQSSPVRAPMALKPPAGNVGVLSRQTELPLRGPRPMSRADWDNAALQATRQNEGAQ